MKFTLVSKVMGISVKPAKLRTVLFNWSRFHSVTLLCFTIGKKPHITLANLGLETVVSVLFTNTRTCLPYNERELSAVLKISSSLYGKPVRVFVSKTRTRQSLILLIFNMSSLRTMVLQLLRVLDSLNLVCLSASTSLFKLSKSSLRYLSCNHSGLQRENTNLKSHFYSTVTKKNNSNNIDKPTLPS